MAKYSAKAYSQVLRKLAQVPSRIAAPVAAEIAKAIDRQFDAGTDPYGRPWAPLKPATLRKGRHPPPLTDTGAGRDSVRVTPARGAGLSITIGEAYMGVHQAGDLPRMVARKILPEGVLPKVWNAIYQRALTEGVRSTLGGK